MTIKEDKDMAYKVKSLFNCKLITNIQGYDQILTEHIISCCIIDFHKTNFRIMHFVLEFNMAFINVFNEFPKMGLVVYIK